MITRARAVCGALALSAVLMTVLTACGPQTTDGKAVVVAPTTSGAPSTDSSSGRDFPTTDPTSVPTSDAPTDDPTSTGTRSADYFTVSLPTGWRLASSETDSKEYYGPDATGGHAVVAVTRGTTPLNADDLDALATATVARFKADPTTVSVGSISKTTVDGEQARSYPIVLKASGQQVAVKVTLVIHDGFGVTITEALPVKAATTLGPTADKVVDSLQWS